MKKSYFFLHIFLLIALKVNGSLADHLKHAENKTGLHQIPGIDFIYMINLDQRPEKFQASIDQLTPFGIYPYRFSAVNGWELTLDTINDIGVKFTAGMPKNLMGTTYSKEGCEDAYDEIMHNPRYTYFCHRMPKGTLGIYLSHLSVLQDAYNAGYETIWVMEDDIYVCMDPNKISETIAHLDRLKGKEGWDILFTDRDTRGQDGNYVPCIGYARRPNFSPVDLSLAATREEIGLGLRSIGARYGAYSMIIRRSGMKKILDFAFKYNIFLPYDMEWQNIPNLTMFTVLDDIVTTVPDALSDNGAPGYKAKKNHTK
ncbi:MAG: hypothetical protein RLZZ453_1056 [Chlamydiota bacterium]|jgi:GR25 family glycosyltransferase involved in LPS biosynthesis